MENQKLNEMKGSEVHRIVAAVLEIVENAQFEPQMDVTLQETEEPDSWKMVFQKKSTDLDELNGIKEQLGNNFTVKVSAKDKSSISIAVVAPSGDFIQLLKKS